MRVLLLFLLFTISLRAEIPALLNTAVEHYSADAERWAYTQASVGKDDKGKTKDDKLVRYDPSLPYEEQWTLLRIDGKEPTERQQAKYRKQQEKRRKEQKSFGEILLFDQAKLIEETETTATFEIPLDKNDNQRLPPEKFMVTARVNKSSGSFEAIMVHLRDSLRVKLVAKIKSGAVTVNFTRIDPRYAAAITSIQADIQASILLVNVGGVYDLTRTELKRVTPYSERFKVKIAPMKFLDF